MPSSLPAAVAQPDRRFKIALAFTTACVVYGATFLGVKVTVENHLPAVTSSGLRYLLAGGALLGVLRARGTAVRLPGQSMARAALLGGLLLAPFGLIALAERDVSSGLTALLFASVPLVVVTLRISVERVRGGPVLVAGALMGFAGVAFMAFAHGERANGTVLGIGLILTAAVAVGFGTFFLPRLEVAGSAFVAAGWQLLWAGVFLTTVGAIAGDWSRYPPSEFGSDGLIAFALLLTVATVPPYVSYVWLLGHVASSKVAATTYVNPLVAVVLGWLVLGERVGSATLIGGAMIVASVAAVSTRAD